MLKGQIFITDDLNVVLNMVHNYRTVTIGEADPQLIQQIGAISGGILMPPYQAVMKELDGDLTGFGTDYFAYLSSKDPSEFIAVLIRALYNGTNVLLYLSKDEAQMNYSSVLLGYLSNMYGIVVGTPNNSCQYIPDPKFIAMYCCLLYQFELFNVEELFTNYPPQYPLYPNIIPKLTYELNPDIPNKSHEGYIQYFNILKEKSKRYNRYVYNPLRSVEQC